MVEPATAPAVLAQAELGMLVLGSDGGPIVLLAPAESGLSNPTQDLGLSNPVQDPAESTPS